MRYIDLFCGIGSFHYSFRKLGFECVFACDIEKVCRDTYYSNYGLMPEGDICTINPANLSEYDMVCAGFPCQPFSNAGKQMGFDDERGSMIYQVMKFVKEGKTRPKLIVLENVQGLLNHDGGRSFAKVKDILQEEGYNIIFKVMKCSDYGIPQMRKRLFIIGYLPDTLSNPEMFFGLDEYKKSISLSEYLGRPFNKEIAYTIRCGGRHSPLNDRHNWDGYIVNGEEYRLTIDDCLRLQGFTDYTLTGTDSKQWKMLGNTIPTVFTEIIGKQIIKYAM